MKKCIFLIFTLFVSCINQDVKNENIESENGAVVQNGNTQPTDSQSDILIKMDEYLENGLNKIFQGSISEGIRQLVSVLAEKENLKGSSEQADEIALKAETELKNLEDSISLEADTMWFDTDKRRITGNTVHVDIQPNVILTATVNTGRTLILRSPSGSLSALYELVWAAR